MVIFGEPILACGSFASNLVGQHHESAIDSKPLGTIRVSEQPFWLLSEVSALTGVLVRESFNICGGVSILGSGASGGTTRSTTVHRGEVPLPTLQRYDLRQNGVQCPVLGIGGVQSATDVLEYIQLGATAVGVCTAAIVSGTGIIEAILQDLQSWCSSKGVAITDMIGCAQTRGGSI
jgi:hypothetical protein